MEFLRKGKPIISISYISGLIQKEDKHLLAIWKITEALHHSFSGTWNKYWENTGLWKTTIMR